MSDNVSYLPSSDPSAVPIAADNISGTRFQRVKLALGTDGTNDGDLAASNPMPVLDERIRLILFQILQALISPGSYDSSQRRQRITAVLEAGQSSIGNIGTVATLGDQTNIGGRPAQMLINQINLSAWADCVRARIT
jgi:hypothetical protein